MKKSVAGLLALTAIPLPSFAQETQLNEVTVTSTTIDDRFHSKRAESSSTNDISGKTVDETRPENMMQILQSIPGVTADVSNGDEIKIKLRGIENQRYMGEKPGVAIVIDGVPVFERTGKVNIDLDNIESIKVIKGGASYLFGDDALSGAVIVTTKRGANYKGVTIGADAGSWGYDRELVRAGLGGDWGTAHIQATHRQSDDWYWQSGYKTEYLDGNLRLYLTDKSDLTFGFEKSDRYKDKHGSVTGANQAANDPQGIIGRDYARNFNVDLQKLHATYSNDLTDKSNFLATVYEYRDHTTFWSGPQRVSATGAVIPNSAQDAYTMFNDYHQTQRGLKSEWRTSGEVAAGLVGGDIRRNEYINYNTALVGYCARTGSSCSAANLTSAGDVLNNNRTNEDVNALYGEIKFALGPRWTLTGNGRYDNITLDYHSGATKALATPFDRSKSFNVTSWRAGTAYAVTDHSDIYGNVSTGFRAPSADQLYNGGISPTGGKTENNENLKPERSLNLELGTRVKTSLFGIAVDTEAAIFQIDRKDYIMSTTGQYSASNATYKEMYDNIGGVRNRGFELALHTDRKLDYTFDAAYTYIQARFTKYDTFFQTLGSPYVASPTMVRFDNTGNDVPRVARHQLDMTFGWQPTEAMRLALEMDARSWSWADETNQIKLPGRTLFTLHGNYDIKGAGSLGFGNRWSLFARIDNLFDRKYWSTARGTNDSANYVTGAYDSVYNANDPSIVVGKPRAWTIGLTANF
jgi:iron complex outermembrane receptor protein